MLFARVCLSAHRVAVDRAGTQFAALVADLAAESASAIARVPNHLETSEECAPLPAGLAHMVRHYGGKQALQSVVNRHNAQSRRAPAPALRPCLTLCRLLQEGVPKGEVLALCKLLLPQPRRLLTAADRWWPPRHHPAILLQGTLSAWLPRVEAYWGALHGLRSPSGTGTGRSLRRDSFTMLRQLDSTSAAAAAQAAQSGRQREARSAIMPSQRSR